MKRLATPLLLLFVGNAWILWAHYDRFWWPPDEGQFVHVAERLLDGDILHRDIREHHTDYGHLVNALAFRVFGRDVVSLRYPLVASALAQSLLAFALLSRQGPWLAMLGALALTSLGFVQFANPTPNWHCLFVAIAAVAALRLEARWRVAAVGFAIGILFGFRQLTGVLLGIGALAYLLAEASEGGRGRGSALARGVVALALIGVGTHLLFATDAVGFLLFGFWPMAALCWCGLRARPPNAVAVRILAHFGAGASAALIPMLAYHFVHGSLADWWRDVFVTALSVPRLWHVELASFAEIMRLALGALGSPASSLALSNALYWLVLPLLAALNGALLMRSLARPGVALTPELALPFFACFYALVSLFNQIPIYLYYSAGFSVLGILAALRGEPPWLRIAAGFGLVWLAGTALYSHAAQPLSRSLEAIAAGTRHSLVRNDRFARASLWMEARDVETYGRLVEAIQGESEAGEPILVLPNDAELYFLAERPSATDFWNSALAITTVADAENVVSRLKARPPALVVYSVFDKYTTASLRPLIDWTRKHYVLRQRIGNFEIYRARNDGASAIQKEFQ